MGRACTSLPRPGGRFAAGLLGGLAGTETGSVAACSLVRGAVSDILVDALARQDNEIKKG